MNGAILAVGSELLGTDRLDTNSLRLTALLERYGWTLVRKAVVGDDEERIGDEVLRMAQEASVVLVGGGLGPTSDDVTRQAVAAALDLGLTEDPAVVEDIRAKFRAFGREMPEVNRRQAMVPHGALKIDNPRGTAPGLELKLEGGGPDGQGATIFLLPGVPRELKALTEGHVEPWLAQRSGGAVRETRTLKVACVPESELEERLVPAYKAFGREQITVLSKPAEITVRYVAEGPEAPRRERLDEMEERLVELIGDGLYARRDVSLEEVVGEALAEVGHTVSTAESCTGGLIAERLTRVAGSSAYFEGSAVTYSNRLKQHLLGVPQSLLESEGAVSEAVARAMAEGVRERLGTTWSVAVTGIAGPGGGTEDKPVGTVHFALAGPAGTVHRRATFPGDRERIRFQTSQVALELLRRGLNAQSED